MSAAPPLDEAAQRRFVAKLNEFRSGLEVDEQRMLDALVAAVLQAHEQGSVRVFWFDPGNGAGRQSYGLTPNVWSSYGTPGTGVNTPFSGELGRVADQLINPTGISGPTYPEAPPGWERPSDR